MAPSNGNGNSMLQQQQQRWRVYVNDERERAQWWREGRHTRYDRFSIYLLFQTSPATLENEPYVLVFKDGEWLPPPPPLTHLPPHPLLSKKSQSCSFLRMGTIHHLPTTHLPIHLLPDPLLLKPSRTCSFSRVGGACQHHHQPSTCPLPPLSKTSRLCSFSGLGVFASSLTNHDTQYHLFPSPPTVEMSRTCSFLRIWG